MAQTSTKEEQGAICLIDFDDSPPAKASPHSMPMNDLLGDGGFNSAPSSSYAAFSAPASQPPQSHSFPVAFNPPQNKPQSNGQTIPSNQNDLLGLFDSPAPAPLTHSTNTAKSCIAILI